MVRAGWGRKELEVAPTSPKLTQRVVVRKLASK